MKPTPRPAEKVKLDGADLRVNRICVGLAPLGTMPDTYGYGDTLEEAHATVRAVLTAEWFSRYVKE